MKTEIFVWNFFNFRSLSQILVVSHSACLSYLCLFFTQNHKNSININSLQFQQKSELFPFKSPFFFLVTFSRDCDIAAGEGFGVKKGKKTGNSYEFSSQNPQKKNLFFPPIYRSSHFLVSWFTKNVQRYRAEICVYDSQQLHSEPTLSFLSAKSGTFPPHV